MMAVSTADVYALVADQQRQLRKMGEAMIELVELTQFVIDKLAGLEAEMSQANEIKCQDAINAAWHGLHDGGKDDDAE